MNQTEIKWETPETPPEPESIQTLLVWMATDKRWAFFCDYSQKHIPKDAGFRWEPNKKQWYTADPFTAMKLIHYSDPETRSGLAKFWNLSNSSFQDSSLSSSDLKQSHEPLEIPRPHGLDYLPYQRVGIEFLVRQDPRCSNTLLADEMGLGKTIQAIGAINYLSDATYNRRLSRVLIVCPNSLKMNWAKELRKWLVSPLSYAIADTKFFPRNHNIVIINYDILEKWAGVISALSWDIKIGDEAHYLKNPTTIRTKNFMKAPAPLIWLLTGTPIVNRHRELFPLIHCLDSEQFPHFIHYGIRYCAGKKMGSTWDFSGSSNGEELQARLRSTIMIRRMKKDVLADLPEKTRTIIELPAPRGLGSLLKQELEAYHEQEPMLEALKLAIREAKAANDTEAYKQAVENFKIGQGKILGDIATLRKEVAMKKIPIVTEYLQTIWKDDPERKIVLWCHHHDVMDAYLREFGTFTTEVYGKQKSPAYALKFSGKESLQERDEAVTRFQNDPRCLLFIGQTLAGGVGITLTASSHCIFAELDWVPGNITQAEDRLHRIGQHDNVLVEHLVLEGSLDCRIAATIVHKQQVIDIAMNNPTKHLEQFSMFSMEE